MIFLPGTDKQFQHLSSKTDFGEKKILIIGGGCEDIVKKFNHQNPGSIDIIVDDENNLVEYRLRLKGDKNIKITFMDFTTTDFPDDYFDFAYAQGSISRNDRNMITDEVFRVLKNDGIYSVGEMVKLKEDAPVFIKDIWNAAKLSPLFINDVENFYTRNGFRLMESVDISSTLKEFYQSAEAKIKSTEIDEMFSSEDKKLLKKFKHEVNAFIKLGGDKVTGFVSLILRKAV